MNESIPYHTETTPHVCPACGRNFPAHPRAVYCSDLCQRQAQKARKKLRRRGLPIPAGLRPEVHRQQPPPDDEPDIDLSNFHGTLTIIESTKQDFDPFTTQDQSTTSPQSDQNSKLQ